MKEKPPIPKCKNPACQCDLFPEKAWTYDRRVKYCPACRAENDKDYDKNRAKQKRTEARDARTLEIKTLRAENEELKRQHEHDVIIMESLQAELAQLRDWDRRTVNDYR